MLEVTTTNGSTLYSNPALQVMDEDKLVKVIYRILCQHKGPIHKFSLSVRSMSRSCPDIDQWIKYFLSRNGIREFILSFNGGGNWYKVHSSLFSCADLRYFRLCRCIIPSHPPTFVGFNDLTYLRLERVFVNNEGFDNLFSNCPKLYALHLLYIDGLDRLNIDYAPTIETLSFVGSLNFCLKNINTPPLIHSTIFFTQLPDMNDNIGNERSVSLINNLNFLSDLRSFTSGSYFLKFHAEGSVRKLLPSTFNNLCDVSFLKLMFEDVDSLSSVLGLITSSPSLRKLVITASRATNSAADQVLETVAEYLEGESCSIGCLMQLRYVEMKYIVGVGPEMELMKLVLTRQVTIARTYENCS